MEIQFAIDDHVLVFSKEGEEDNYIVEINTDQYLGIGHSTELETGLSFYYWDFIIKKPCKMRHGFASMDDERVYVLNYYPNPQHSKVEYSAKGKDYTSSEKQSTLLLRTVPGTINFSYFHSVKFRFLTVVFSHQWLMRQLRDIKGGGRTSGFILQVIQSPIDRVMSVGEIVLVQNLFEIFKEKAYAIEVKSHIYQLISFLYRHAAVVAAKHVDISDYQPIMLKVEKRIIASLYTSMPTLENLAKESFISVSTLKRQFKEVFGLSAYDYYLTKKMELAKQLLETGNLSVNAVAFQLGYESISHFISIFKKAYGYSPGKIKKGRVSANEEDSGESGVGSPES